MLVISRTLDCVVVPTTMMPAWLKPKRRAELAGTVAAHAPRCDGHEVTRQRLGLRGNQTEEPDAHDKSRRDECSRAHAAAVPSRNRSVADSGPERQRSCDRDQVGHNDVTGGSPRSLELQPSRGESSSMACVKLSRHWFPQVPHSPLPLSGVDGPANILGAATLLACAREHYLVLEF